MTSEKVNAATRAGAARAEQNHLPALQAAYERLIRQAGRRAARAFREQTTHLTAAAVPKWTPPTANLIDEPQLTADANRKTARSHQAILKEAVAPADIGISWTVTHPTSQALLASVAARQDTLGAALREQVNETITEGYAAGWSVPTTAAAIVAKVDSVAPARAAMYARTDLNALANGGSLMAAQIVGEAGGVNTKTWLNAGDDRVRPDHVVAEGQTVPLDQQFTVGGEPLDYPCDPNGSDEQTANCRCSLTYGTNQRAEGVNPFAASAADFAVWRDYAWEGAPDLSTVQAASLPFGGNMETLTVTRDEYDELVAAATGSTSLPLSSQGTAWDAGAARKTLEPADYAKAHFWRDPAGPADEIGSYKLPFAQRINGTLTAVWRGVTAGAQRLSQTDIPAADKKAVQAKMGAYYRKAAGQFKDDTIKVPWGAEKASAETVETLRALSPDLDSLSDSEILGVQALILAAQSKHRYAGSGGACAICDKAASNDDAHFAAEAETLTVAVTDFTLIAAADGGPTRWTGTLLVEGEPFEDGRTVEPGTTTWRDGPTLPLGFMRETPHSDVEKAPLCGAIDTIWRAGNSIMGSGYFSDTSDDPVLAETGSQALAAVKENLVNGISVDLIGGEINMVFSPYEKVGEDLPEDYAENQGGGMDSVIDRDKEPEQDEQVLAPPEGEWLKVLSSMTIGSACIVPVPADSRARIAVVASVGALEVWRATRLMASSALVASTVAAPLYPPAEWFENPRLKAPTPLTVTDDGRVFGHIGQWTACHKGYDRCLPPPRSKTGYAHFHQGTLKTEAGEMLRVGKLTLAAGHAPTEGYDISAERARAHYDNTATVAAFVRAGEDEHGIWVAGSLRTGITEAMVQDLTANAISGDWRNREMIAAHAVPSCGFPIIQASAIGEDGEEETALIITSTIQLEQAEELSPLAYLRPGRTKAAA